MATQRQIISTSVDPETSIADVTFGTQGLNTYIDRYGDARIYTTQRPAFVLSQDTDDSGITVDRGRGVYFWEAIQSIIIVNDGKVLKGYGGTEIGDITEGRDRVYFIEATNDLIIIDPENNEGWIIAESDSDNIAPIIDPSFPPNNGLELAGGGAFLGGFVFVLTVNGQVWNSIINDPTTWDGLNFIDTEREADRGVFLGSHHDNLVAISTRSIEFFFNQGNPIGSPLGRRNDVAYKSGAPDAKGIFVKGDSLFLIGNDQKGVSGLYELRGFKLNKRSNFSIDGALSFFNIKTSLDFFLSAATIDDHPLVFVTPVVSSATSGIATWVPLLTLVFDSVTSTWTTYETTIKSTIGFAVVDTTDISTQFTRNVGFLLTDGFVFQVDGTIQPLDSDFNDIYFAEDYLADDPDQYMEENGPILTSNIEMSTTLPEVDFGTVTNKFMHSLWVVGTTLAQATDTISTLDISWTDDHYQTFTTPRNMDIQSRRKLTRLGRFKRRAFKLDYAGSDKLRLEALEFNVGVSQYA